MNNNLSQEEMEKLPSSFYTQAVAIFHLNEVGIEVKQTRIADWLDVSRANISQMCVKFCGPKRKNNQRYVF